jgi:proteasome activator-like protein
VNEETATTESSGSQPDAGADAAEGDRPLDAEKLLRIASLASQVLEEARHLDHNDENAAKALAGLHRRVTSQLYEALPNALVKELEAMDLDQPFAEEARGQEVRIAYAALIGWLGGLLQGLQAAMQMAHMQQIQLARQLPAMPQSGASSATGQYL